MVSEVSIHHNWEYIAEHRSSLHGSQEVERWRRPALVGSIVFYYIQASSFWMVLPKFWMALHPLDNPPWKCLGASQSSHVNSPINHHLLLDSNMTVTSHLPQVKTETLQASLPALHGQAPPKLTTLWSQTVTTSLAHSYCLPVLPRQVELFPPHRVCLLYASSFRYLCLPPLCPLCVFPPTHLLSEDFSVLRRVGIPQPPSCLDLSLCSALCRAVITFYLAF